MRLLTERNLTVLLIGMLLAIALLAALCVGRYLGPPMRFELPILVVGLLVVLIGMFAGAGVVMAASHGTKDQTAFAFATPVEKTVWLGGAVVALVVAGTFVYSAFHTGARWMSAFEPLMICSLTVPALAQISVGRRLARDRSGASQCLDRT